MTNESQNAAFNPKSDKKLVIPEILSLKANLKSWVIDVCVRSVYKHGPSEEVVMFKFALSPPT